MKTVVWILVVLLVILHQDNWNWTDGTLVLGFMPMGLVWHVGISLGAAAVWFLATQVAWPEGLDVEDESEASHE